MEYDDILSIDETLLDEEWIKQPKLFYKHACRLAETRTRVDDIKNQLEIQKTEVENVKAHLDMSIRNNPEEYNISGKVTEAAIKNVVSVQPECKRAIDVYNELQKELIQAKNDSDVLQALVSALDHKKTALENLVKLHGQNYFSTPRMPQQEQSREFIEETLKRKAREKTKVRKEAE
jgi:hypothetical protein